MSCAALLVLGGGAYATAPAGSARAGHRRRTVLRYTATSGRHGANHFVLRRNGANMQLLDSDTGALLRNVPLARISSVSIAGADGAVDNTLTLDFSGGSLAVPGGISYAGGRGGYNVLAIHDGHFAHESETAFSPHSGVMLFDGAAVRYSEIAPINDTAVAANFTINATAAAETINVVNGPVLTGVQTTQVSSVGNTFELINFAHKATVTINGNGGNDTFNLNSTIAAVSLTSIELTSAERESSTFNVAATPVATHIVGGGIDTANIGSAGDAEAISVPISVTDPREFIAVHANDSAGASSRFVTINSSDTISGFTASTVSVAPTDVSSITLDGPATGNTFIVSGPVGPGNKTMPVTLNTGMGTDSTFVQLVAAGTTVAIHGQSGNDGIAINNAGTLGGILGPVKIDNIFGFAALVVDDSKDTQPTATTIAEGGGVETITGLAPSTISVAATDLGNFTVDGGSGGNTNTISSVKANGGTVTLNTGTGADATSVGTVSGNSPLDINGQTGKDSVQLGSNGSVQSLTAGATITNGSATTLSLNDSADATARAVAVGSTAVSGLAPMPISYAGVSSLAIEGGAPSDTFAVTPSTTTAYNIVGGGSPSATPPGNELTMELAGLTSPALTGTPGATGVQGEWTFANASQVGFSHMQTLNPTSLSVGDTATTVGGSGISPLLFEVSLLAPATQPVSATYASADGTATVASGAYQPANGTVLFPAGATTETVAVNALGAPTVRPPQTLLLGLVSPVNALIGRSRATGTITDSFTPGPPPTPTAAAAAPLLTHLAQTRKSWRAGRVLAAISRVARRAPLGTSFSFALNEPATVTFVFNRKLPGRRVHGHCVAETKKNHHSHACPRSVTAGTLHLSAPAGTDHVSFQGRLPGATLKPGTYTVAVSATNASGQHSTPSSLSFTVVK